MFVDVCFVKLVAIFSLNVSGVLVHFDEGPTQIAYARTPALIEMCYTGQTGHCVSTTASGHITDIRLWHQQSALSQYFVDTKHDRM